MRCATILLVSGWLLLLPPFVSKGRFDEKRPLKEWDHDSSYDTAQECEEFRNRMWARYKEQKNSLFAERILTSRCIPSDIYPGLTR
jgi:hypothetical protein